MLASYFAGVMVRLILTLTPIVCVASALAISTLIDVYLSDVLEDTADPDSPSPVPAIADSKKPKKQHVKKNHKKTLIPSRIPGIYTEGLGLNVLIPVTLILCQFALHCTYVTSSSYSSPSVVLASTRADGSMAIIVLFFYTGRFSRSILLAAPEHPSQS